MTAFLHSGRRRDICAILAGNPLQAQALKSRLGEHDGERIDPKSFYGALDALENAGYVETRTEGIHDVYALTDEGERRLRDHVAWLAAELDCDLVEPTT